MATKREDHKTRNAALGLLAGSLLLRRQLRQREFNKMQPIAKAIQQHLKTDRIRKVRPLPTIIQRRGVSGWAGVHKAAIRIETKKDAAAFLKKFPKSRAKNQPQRRILAHEISHQTPAGLEASRQGKIASDAVFEKFLSKPKQVRKPKRIQRTLKVMLNEVHKSVHGPTFKSGWRHTEKVMKKTGAMKELKKLGYAREDPKYVKTYFEEMKQHNVPFNTRMQWLSRVYGGRNGYSSEELYKIVTGKQKDQYFIFPFVKHAPPEVNRILERTYRRHRAQGATKEAAAIASWAKVKQAGYVKEHKLQPSWVKKETKMPTKKNYANPGLDWAASLPHFTPDIPTPIGLRPLLARGSAVATTVGKRVGRSMSLATKAALMSVVINDLLERLSKKGHPYIPRIQPDLELLSSFELKEHVVKYIDAIPTPLLQKLRQNTGRVAVQARKGAERGLLVWLLGFLTSELMGRGISRPKKEQTLIVPQLPRVAPQQQYMRIAETGERLPRSGFQRMNLKNMADDLGPMPTWKKSNRFGRNSRVLAAMAPIVGLAARQIALGLRDKPTLIDEARARWNSSKKRARKRARKRAKQKRYAIDMRRLRKLGQMGLKTGGKVVKTGGKVLGTASNIALPLLLASDIVGMMRQPVDQGQRPKPPVSTTTIGGQPTRMKRKKEFQQQEVVTMYPMQSQAQRRWMHATHPAMAEEWEEHTPKGKKLPEHKKKKKTYAMSPEFVEAVRRARTNAAMQPPRPIRTSTIALVLGAGLASKAMNRRKELEKQQQQHRERLAKLNAKTKVKMAVTKQKQYASPAAVLKLAPRIKSLAGFKGESKAADAIAKDILAWARQRAGRMRTLADNAGKTVIPVGKSKITANRFFGKEAVEWDTVADQLSDMAKRHKLEKRAAVAAATTAATAAAGATGREVGKKEENARIKSAIG